MKNNENRGLLTLEGAKIIFKNLEGRPTKFNRHGGVRSFNILFREEDAELAATLMRDGWNLAPLPNKDDPNAPPKAWRLPVAVDFEHGHPAVYTVTKTAAGKLNVTALGVETVAGIDMADIDYCDITVRGSRWVDEGGFRHVKAYLKTMYVNLNDDPLAMKYQSLIDDDDPLDMGE